MRLEVLSLLARPQLYCDPVSLVLLSDLFHLLLFFCFNYQQHHQWICPAAKTGAQAVPHPSSHSPSQSQMFKSISRSSKFLIFSST